MRKSVKWVAIPMAVVGVASAVAVGKFARSSKPADQFSADLQNAQAAGLDLAQAQGSKKYALTEIAPDSKPQPAKTLKKSNGPKAIRSKTPSVKAAPEPVAAQAVEDIPQTQTTETAAPTPAPVPVPVTPTPVPQTGQSDGPILAGGTARGRTGDGGGGILGGIFGAIIRGGVVGDGDNCDPRPSSGGRRGDRPVYGGGGIGGMGTGRMTPRPTFPSSGPIAPRPRGLPR
jgi:type II secretory pathway pseudopilin PulG